MSPAPEDAGTLLEVLVAAGQAAVQLGAMAGVLDAVWGLVEGYEPDEDSRTDVRDAAEELIRQLRALLGRIGEHEARQ